MGSTLFFKCYSPPPTKILIRRHNCNLRSLKKDSLLRKNIHVFICSNQSWEKTSLKISLFRIHYLSFSRHVYTLEKALKNSSFHPFFCDSKNPFLSHFLIVNHTEMKSITSYSMHFYDNIMSNVHRSKYVVNYRVFCCF